MAAITRDTQWDIFLGRPVVGNDQQGAEDTAEEELAPAHKKVVQQLQLDGRPRVEVATPQTRRQTDTSSPDLLIHPAKSKSL